MKSADAFCKKLDEIQCNYRRGTDCDGQEMLFLRVSGSNFSDLQFCVLFNNDTSAQIYCPICKFSAEKNLLVLQVVNQLNFKYRWTKYSATTSGLVQAVMDIEIAEDTAADILYNSLHRMNIILDEVYPIIMKAIYS